jgi:hypothetical protein
MHPKQTLGIAVPFASLHHTLVSQKRWVLGEKHAKSCISHPITGIFASALVL